MASDNPLEKLADEIVSVAYDPGPGGLRRPRSIGALRLRSLAARCFRLGMSVGWDNAMDAVEEMYPGTRDDVRKGRKWPG
jgi:hypothetical protein